MTEKLQGVKVDMGARTAAEAAEDLEAIAAVLRSGGGAMDLPSRLMFGPRALDVSVLKKSK